MAFTGEMNCTKNNTRVHKSLALALSSINHCGMMLIVDFTGGRELMPSGKTWIDVSKRSDMHGNINTDSTLCQFYDHGNDEKNNRFWG